MIRVQPTSVLFPNISIGQRSELATIEIENRSTSPVSLTIQGQSDAAAADFPITIPNMRTTSDPHILPAGQVRLVRAAFVPRNYGIRRRIITITASDAGQRRDVSVELEGTAVVPGYMSSHEVSLSPKDDLEKMGRHYVLTVSDPEFVSALAFLGAEIDGYMAVPAATHGGRTKDPGYIRRPGEVTFPATDAFTDADSVLCTYELNRINPEWLIREHATILSKAVRNGVRGRIAELIENRVRDLSWSDPALGPLQTLVPRRGELLEVNRSLYVAWSPETINAFLTSRFLRGGGTSRSAVAYVLRAVPALPEDQSNSCGIRTRSVGRFGELYVPCFDPFLYKVRPQDRTGQLLDELPDITSRLSVYFGL